MPARVIPQSMVGPGFLAHMLTGKYMDHVPYYRQERIDRRGGLDISAKARVRYTQECALLLLTIHYQLVQRILGSGYVSVDETVVKLIDPDRRHKAQTSYLCKRSINHIIPLCGAGPHPARSQINGGHTWEQRLRSNERN